MIIVDKYGNEQDWVWLVANYGPIVLHPANAGPGYRVAILRENANLEAKESKPGEVFAPATQIVTVLDVGGNPIEGAEVARYWPGAPDDSDAGPINGVPEGMTPNLCVHGSTNTNGDIGFGMGEGDYFKPPERGASAVWLHGAQTNSDVVFGLGMIVDTDHYHIDVVFQWSEGGEEPPGCPREEVLAILAKTEKRVNNLRGDLVRESKRLDNMQGDIDAMRALLSGDE